MTNHFAACWYYLNFCQYLACREKAHRHEIGFTSVSVNRMWYYCDRNSSGVSRHLVCKQIISSIHSNCICFYKYITEYLKWTELLQRLQKEVPSTSPSKHECSAPYLTLSYSPSIDQSFRPHKCWYWQPLGDQKKVKYCLSIPRSRIRGREVYAHSFLHFDARWRLVVKITPRPRYPLWIIRILFSRGNVVVQWLMRCATDR